MPPPVQVGKVQQGLSYVKHQLARQGQTTTRRELR